MKHHWPIFRTAFAASAPLVLVGWIHWGALATTSLSLTLLAWFLCGILYTQLVEYWCHRVPMHQGLPYLGHVRWNHLDHHRIFHGENFTTRNVDDLAHIVGRFWVFPLLFVAHYAALVLVVPADALVVFLFGTVLHYLVFELSHYLTHIEDNVVDGVIARIPVLAGIRAYQIEHHRIHHEVPVIAFNFNPPYLGDRITGHMPDLDEPLGGVPFEAPVPVPAPALPMQPHGITSPGWGRRVVRYGALAAAGFAIVGAVVVAHGVLSHGKRSTPSPEQAA